MCLRAIHYLKLGVYSVLAVLCLTLSLSSNSSFANDCATGILRERLRLLSENLPPAFELLQGIDPELISGVKTPKWQDFDRLERIITALQESKKSAIDAGKLKEWRSTFRAIKKSLSEFPEIEALQAASKKAAEKTSELPAEPKPSTAYLPSEYELKHEFQVLLTELNRELPPSLRIKGIRPPKSDRIPTLLAQARRLVANQEKRFRPFFSDSGFKDSAALHKALHEYSPEAAQLADDLANENVEMAMNRPENARWWVPKVGFQNQRITGSSKGMMNPGKRNRVEAKLTGQDLTEYTATDDQFKPVYGYLKPKPSETIKQSTRASQYGPDTYVFKKDKVKNRLTWTPADSFGVEGYAPELPTDKPQNWKGFFVPWKARMLIAPDVLQNLADSRKGFEALRNSAPNSEPIPKAPIAPPNPAYPPYPGFLPKDFGAPQPDLSALPPLPPKPAEPNYWTSPPTPPAPKSLTLPTPPLIPPLKPGETFDEAFKAYNESKPRKDYELEVARIRTLNEERQKSYLESDAYLESQRKSQEAQADYNRRVKEYRESPEFKAYAMAVSEIE